MRPYPTAWKCCWRCGHVKTRRGLYRIPGRASITDGMMTFEIAAPLLPLASARIGQ